MPDTRKQYLLADRGWQTKFKTGVGGQQNGLARDPVKLDNEWSWQSHLTVERVCVNPGARDFEKKYVVSAWHVTLELGSEEKDGEAYRRHALHWKYDSAKDIYVCKGWKQTYGKPKMPLFPELRYLPSEVIRVNNPFAEMPFFESSIAEEDRALTEPQKIKILSSIDVVVRKYETVFGARKGIFEAAKWTKFVVPLQ